MTSIFYAVAILCQINANYFISDIEIIQKEQLECQKYYAKCLEINTVFNDHTLAKCIVKK